MSRELSHMRPSLLKDFFFGAPYYPEHWDHETRLNDATLMEKAGFTMVRMGEFAWDLMEPSENHYDFGLFEETIDLLGNKGIGTMLCTPTATPPRWLTGMHPDILRVDADGRTMQHGSRQHACHANSVFREYSRRITQAMANHFKSNRFVAGWQTDNEFHCHFSECHCENCNKGFQAFLCGKYHGEIAELNRAWGTSFWAQNYRSFEEVPTPRENRPTYVNPSHQLDYFRFLSRSVTDFQHDQVAILRAVQQKWFITHNGTFNHIDYRGDFARDLDILGYDSYPFFDYDPASRPCSHAFNLDRMRAWSGNFIIPEQQSGAGGQKPYFHDSPEPGEMRRLTYASIARGADSLLYFRWRSCRFGAEEYWLGLIDHDNVPRRRYHEAAKVGSELSAIGPELPGTWVHVEAAVASSDEDVTDGESCLPFGLPSPDSAAATVHRILYKSGFATGCIHPEDDLSDVKLYFIPHWTLFKPEWVGKLQSWVEQGGVLVIGARTATRNWDNCVVDTTIPGCLRELAALTVEEYGKQNAPKARPLEIELSGKRVRSEHWYEMLNPDSGTDTIAIWQGRHLSGSAAITRKKRGAGSVYYVGTYFTDTLSAVLVPFLAEVAGLKPLWPNLPDNVEVSQRRNKHKRLWFFINQNSVAATITTTPAGTDLITGSRTGGPLVLEANGVAVVREIVA